MNNNNNDGSGIGFFMVMVIATVIVGLFGIGRYTYTHTEPGRPPKQVFIVSHEATDWRIPDSIMDIAGQRAVAIAGEHYNIDLEDVITQVGKLYQRPHYKFYLKSCQEYPDGRLLDCVYVDIRSEAQKKIFDSLVAFKISQFDGVQK